MWLEPARAGRALSEGATNAPPPGLLSTAYAQTYLGAPLTRRLMREAGLWPDGTLAPPTISKVAFWHLCVAAMELTGDESNGCAARPVARWTWATVFSAVNQMDTLGEGLRKLAELSAIIPAEIEISLTHSAAGAHLNFRSTGTGGDAARRECYVESIALAFHCVLLWVTGEPLRPVQVRLSERLADAHGSLLSGLSRRRTRQKDGVTVVYPRADLEKPLGVRKYRAWCSHETSTFLQFVALLDYEVHDRECPTVEQVQQLIAGQPISQSDAARSLGLSTATLRRRLADAGTSFRDISKAAKLRQLLRLLASDDNLDDVAAELGLSDRRSLWRACHAWLGVSPSIYRANRRTEIAA